MQLPGMSTDHVRLSIDVTWWPESGDFSMSRRLWTRPASSSDWRLEDMQTTASPVGLVTLPDRWHRATDLAMRHFLELVESQGDPF